MKKLLKKIQEYSVSKGYPAGLSLIIESDGSGMLVTSPYDKKSLEEPIFEFNKLKELKKEVK